MSLILCRQEPVTSPYFVEELGVHLYSSQELNYVIYHHPLLVMEDFVNERLAAFLRTELRLPFLAERIQKWIQSRGPPRRHYMGTGRRICRLSGKMNCAMIGRSRRDRRPCRSVPRKGRKEQ